MNKKATFWTICASSLMIIVALARGLGGLTLLLKGKNIELSRPIIANNTEITFIGIGLILIAILFVISAVGILMKKSLFWKLGIITAILFVIGGAINGTLLFGQPLETGTIINIVAAIIIISFLIFGKKYFGGKSVEADAGN